jgi:hypothetical protein
MQDVKGLFVAPLDIWSLRPKRLAHRVATPVSIDLFLQGRAVPLSYGRSGRHAFRGLPTRRGGADCSVSHARTATGSQRRTLIARTRGGLSSLSIRTDAPLVPITAR